MNEEILYKVKVVDEASKNIKKIENSLKGLGSTSNIAKFKKNIDDVNKSLKTTADSMQGIGLKSGLVLVGVTKRLYDFEKQMNTISSVTGKSATEIKTFRDKALELGASTQFTSTEVAKLGVVFARAGFSVEDSTVLLSDALNMAGASGITLEESASLLANTIRAYGFEIKDATRITDIFSTGANDANMTIEQFNELISKTGAVSQIANVELERSMAMFEVLRDNSLEASVAATGLGATMMRLSSRNKGVANALESINIEQENFIKMPFDKKLELLASKNMDLATATELFGMEHAKTALVLIRNLEQVDSKYDKLKKSSGSAQKAQEAMMSGLVGATMRFLSALDGLVFSLGEGGLTGHLEKALNFLTDLIDKMNNSSPIIRNLASFVLMLGTSLIALSFAIRFVIFISIGLKAILILINGIILLYASRVLILNGILKAWAIANAILTGTMALLNLSLLPMIATILAVLGAIYLLYQGYKKIMSIVNKDNEMEQGKADSNSKNESDDMAGALEQIKSLTKNYSSSKTPTGEINVKVESSNNAKAEASIIKQSGLRLGVQQ
jgi:TP901 family phage tail tape measure protein